MLKSQLKAVYLSLAVVEICLVPVTPAKTEKKVLFRVSENKSLGA